MREHTYLSAMVSFVTKHVTQHFWAGGPGPSPAIPAKLFDLSATAERFCEHLGAASGAFRQPRARLLLCAAGTLELSYNFQVRSCKPDPLGADIVDVGKNRCDRANLAWRFRCPCRWVKMRDKDLVHALIGGEDLHGGSAQLSLKLGLWSTHGTLLLDLMIRWVASESTIAPDLQFSEPAICGDIAAHSLKPVATHIQNILKRKTPL
jgi:hypothetical protein